jgi:hypothetical protein
MRLPAGMPLNPSRSGRGSGDVLVELWTEGALERLTTLRREPPGIGELLNHAGASWRVLRVEPAEPAAFRPVRAIVERAI